MRLEVGKEYRTRGGQKVINLLFEPEENYCFTADIVGGKNNKIYQINGEHGGGNIKRIYSDDIVSLWEEPETEYSSVSASGLLKSAAKHMEDRASTYDSPDGERSMARTVAVFNQFHGTEITVAQGWHFMQILKDVRLFSRKIYHTDSAEDCIAYSALKAEAKYKDRDNG